MREILFRGKRKDNGEWMEGAFYTFYNFKRVVTQILGDRTNTVPDAFEVDPDTIGQSTGRYDKNERRIYEDDIILKTYKDGHPAPQRFRMMYHTRLPITERVYYGPCDYVEQAVEYEVVGNIHDNKEAAPC